MSLLPTVSCSHLHPSTPPPHPESAEVKHRPTSWVHSWPECCEIGRSGLISATISPSRYHESSVKAVAALSRCYLEIQLAAICSGRDPDTATCTTQTWGKQDVRPSSEVRGGGVSGGWWGGGRVGAGWAVLPHPRGFRGVLGDSKPLFSPALTFTLLIDKTSRHLQGMGCVCVQWCVSECVCGGGV